jgi:hypothetical protein
MYYSPQPQQVVQPAEQPAIVKTERSSSNKHKKHSDKSSKTSTKTKKVENKTDYNEKSTEKVKNIPVEVLKAEETMSLNDSKIAKSFTNSSNNSDMSALAEKETNNESVKDFKSKVNKTLDKSVEKNKSSNEANIPVAEKSIATETQTVSVTIPEVI